MSAQEAMFFCSTLIGGFVLLIVFLVFLRKRKSSQKLKSRISYLRDKANAWEDTEIVEFDPGSALLDSDFNEMIGGCVKFKLCIIGPLNFKVFLKLRCYQNLKSSHLIWSLFGLITSKRKLESLKSCQLNLINKIHQID